MGGLGVYLLDLEVDFAEIVSQLVFPSLDVGIDFLDLGGNLGVSVFKFNQGMLCHFPTHMVSEDFAVHTKGFAADTAIEFKFDGIVLVAVTKLLRLFSDLNSLMFGGQFRSMVILIALHAEVGIFCDAEQFGGLRRNLGAIFTERSLGLLLFVSIDDIVDDKDGQNLIVFEDDILMLEHLRILFLIVEVNRFESLRAGNGLVDELVLAVAVRLAD